MAEIKVGDKVRLTQDVAYGNHKKGDIGVVTRISSGLSGLITRVHMEYNNTSGDTTPFTSHEIELVEELEPLKLEHLKVGQLVIRKRDDWQRYITEVNGDEIEYLCGYKGEHLAIKMDSQALDFLEYFRLPDISEVAQFKKDNPETFAEYTVATPSYKVGDYFTNTDKDIVWKVTGFPSRDEVKTKALMVTDGLDFAETVTLSREVVLSLDGATPEQIEAFENHPYWGKQEPVADAISPEEDAVNHPSHYTSDPSGVECIQITRHRNFNVGNAIKYLWRAGLKKSEGRTEQDKQIEDLKKAVFYIQDEIKRLES